MKKMLLDKLQIDSNSNDLVICSMGKGKIFRIFEDEVEAQDLDPKIWVLAIQIPKVDDDKVAVELNFLKTKTVMIKKKQSSEVEFLTECTPRLMTVNKKDTLEELKQSIMSQLEPLFPHRN